ncbi:MAG: T9SS type A sorting domain-containing protein [Saprospiraceae bacterium]|nr:T9SS type A sorting domain-containing protein [Saprospiraceae bacterium]
MALSSALQDLLKAQEVGFQMMPNPMTHQSELQTNPDYKMKRLTIYDINGRAIREVKQINSNHYTREMHYLKGVYYLK